MARMRSFGKCCSRHVLDGQNPNAFGATNGNSDGSQGLILANMHSQLHNPPYVWGWTLICKLLCTTCLWLVNSGGLLAATFCSVSAWQAEAGCDWSDKRATSIAGRDPFLTVSLTWKLGNPHFYLNGVRHTTDSLQIGNLESRWLKQ